MKDLLWGRKLLESELSQKYLSETRYQELPTTLDLGRYFRCLRCGCQELKERTKVKESNGSFYYCRECLILGRVQSNQSFYHLPQPNPETQDVTFEWQGQLSHSQKIVSNVLVRKAEKKENHLVWAVTGAGKTEMLFEMINRSLARGERLVLTTPRVDVCLELYPRLQSVFPQIKISLLYGEQEGDYFYSNFVICTTHQLLRFYQAFDVMIVDEVDAFPFVNNQQLAFGVSQARKLNSSLIYLTATPTGSLFKSVSKKELSMSKVAVRYHQVALPVPKLLWLWQGSRNVKRHRLPVKLENQLRSQFDQKRLSLLFCPQISLMETLANLIQKRFPTKRIEFVYAAHPNRQEIVQNMRLNKYDLLLTSTILERGVTFKGIDVIVFESNHQVFNTAALVQIAGRAGRSSDSPYGKVYFFHSGRSKAINQAIKQINEMNELAEKEGWLKE